MGKGSGRLLGHVHAKEVQRYLERWRVEPPDAATELALAWLGGPTAESGRDTIRQVTLLAAWRCEEKDLCEGAATSRVHDAVLRIAEVAGASYSQILGGAGKLLLLAEAAESAASLARPHWLSEFYARHVLGREAGTALTADENDALDRQDWWPSVFGDEGSPVVDPWPTAAQIRDFVSAESRGSDAVGTFLHALAERDVNLMAPHASGRKRVDVLTWLMWRYRSLPGRTQFARARESDYLATELDAANITNIRGGRVTGAHVDQQVLIARQRARELLGAQDATGDLALIDTEDVFCGPQSYRPRNLLIRNPFIRMEEESHGDAD